MIDIEGLTAMNMNQPRVHLGNVAEDMNFSEHAIDSSMPPGNLYGGSAFPGMNMFSTGFNVAQNCKNQVGSLLFTLLFITFFFSIYVTDFILLLSLELCWKQYCT